MGAQILCKKRPERGAAIILFTVLVAFVIMPIMGLGIDASIQFWIKAKLSSAVDSAALAAARSLNVGNTILSQTAAAQAVGRQYFAANFPPGTLGTTVFGGQDSGYPSSPTITILAPSNYITVTVTAQVSAPLYFLRLLHLPSGTIAATSQTTRRNANIMLVLDRSGSMNNNGSCSSLIQVVENFANQFIDGRDQIGLVTFSTAAEVDYHPTKYFKSDSPSLNSVIAGMVCVGATSSEQGLSLGYNQLITAINQPGALNVIVFFTDGGANAVYATYPIKKIADSNSRYDYSNTSAYYNYPGSPCNSSDILTGIDTDVSDSLNLTGATAGVINATPSGISGGSGNPPGVSAPGCTFTSNNNTSGWGPVTGREDIAYIPAKDADANPTSGTGYKVPFTYPNGPYVGQIRADSPQSIRYAAMNVADNMAQTIRSNSVYGVVTYAIGLSGNEAIPMDTDFLARLANDQSASNFNPNQPVGQFFLATDAASLSDAFISLSSQILRLSK
jgi:Flp pilus assembly protein TadG